MAGITRPNWSLPPSQRQPAPTPTNPNAPPSGPTPTQTPSPGVSGAAPGAQQYPATPGSFNNNPGGQNPTGTKYDVDPTGTMTPYTPFSSGPGQTSWRAGDPTDLFQLGQDRLLGLFRALRQEGGGGPVSLNREPGLRMVGRETPSTMADRTAAESAAFGRAKDRIGKVGKSALDTLRDRASSMGMGGSTAEANALRDVTTSTQSQLGEVIRDQAIDSLDRADQIDDRNLTAGLTQRGQDIGQAGQEFTGNIAQRGQDFQGAMNDPTRQMIMQLLSSFAGGGGAFMPRLY